MKILKLKSILFSLLAIGLICFLTSCERAQVEETIEQTELNNLVPANLSQV